MKCDIFKPRNDKKFMFNILGLFVSITIWFLKMTEASELEFVEIIREFPVLYDKKHPKYLNNQHKAVIWTQISEKANLTGNELENDKYIAILA